ncbi:MAG: tRNA pseudouridine(38-40) synthase TruA [Bacteroidales bacterium]|jgi:tRNA pseudouridine38-40 synthase|nr:tRNA pseudouridine(38-40) synthase TruA [Bacteroidales bacterium]
MQRYFLKLAYHGGNYHGWQIQPNAVSVQEIIENALATLLQEKTPITGCGRTDTGVHAKQFYLHFDSTQADLHQQNFLFRLNRFLPKAIAVYECFPVSADAHARFDALSRTYEYHIHQGKNPFLQGLSLSQNQLPDIARMNEACSYLFHYSDFTSFAKLHADNKTNECKIMKAEWQMHDDQMIFTIQADRFLRNMVRAIVGTLLEISDKSKSASYICDVIEAKDRSAAGKSVSANALYLTNVEYPNAVFEKIKKNE